MEKKVTKKDVLEAIVAIVEEGLSVNVSSGAVVTAQDILDYAERTANQIDAKAAKAAETAAKKRAEGDELRAAVQAVLTDDYQITVDILEKIADEFPEATKAKVTARLTQLVKAGIAEKEQVKLEDGRKVMGYRINDKVEVED